MPNSRPRKLTPKAMADWAKNAAVVFVEFNGVLMRKSIERRGGGSAHQSAMPHAVASENNRLHHAVEGSASFFSPPVPHGLKSRGQKTQRAICIAPHHMR